MVFYFSEASDSPPYILVFTNCLDGMGMNILWVSIMQYMTSLAPPALTATAISIMATIIWVLGKGVRAKTVHFNTVSVHRNRVQVDGNLLYLSHRIIVSLSRLDPCWLGCCTTCLA